MEIMLFTAGIYQGTFCSNECKLTYKEKKNDGISSDEDI
jgi:hypothetical protein